VFIFWKTQHFNLLKDSLAMSILPEGSLLHLLLVLGSWRLIQKEAIVKKSETVRNLGSATMFAEKTGTQKNRHSINTAFFAATNYTKKRAMEYGRGKKKSLK
jgi:hypothetical protein